MNSKGISIPDNLVAFLLFSAAFIYVVSAMSGYITPYLEREEYGSISMEGYTVLEKIISDPSCGIVVRDHVLNYDRLVEFKADLNSYEELKDALNVKNDFVIEVASTFTAIDTLGIVDTNDTAPSNPDRIILPEGRVYFYKKNMLTDEIEIDEIIKYQYTIDDKIYYNLERLTIGNETYEVLVVPHMVIYEKENGDHYCYGTVDKEGKRYYDRIYIDRNKNRNFQDEVDQYFYGYSADDKHTNPISGFGEGDIFQLLQAPTRIESLRVVGIDSNGYRVYFLNRKAVDMWVGDPSMMKYFPEKGELPTGGSVIAVFTRLVLMEENEELKEKRLVFTIRD